MAGGRPTLYNPVFCQKVIDLGRLGKSITQMASELDVCKDSMYEWGKNYPEFSDALRRAKQLSQAWWEDKGQDALEKPGFQSSLWAKQVSCRFPEDYRETTRNELTGKDGEPIKFEAKVTQTDEEIIARFLKSRGSDAASD